MLYVKETRIERVNAGGTDLQYVYKGSDNTTHKHLQFCRIPSDYATKNLTLDNIAILTVESSGTGSPGDKISNYAYVDSTLLIEGKKYAFLIATAGKRKANRQLSDGTEINSRGYNSGDLYRIDNLDMADVETGNVVNNAQYNYQGCFEYNPKTIIAGNGSYAYGHLIAKNTYNVSDRGKGGIKVYIYEYTALKSLFKYAYARTGSSNWIFNETVYSN